MQMQIVAISRNAWDGQWMNRQHLMWAMKEHAPVLYVQEPETWHRSHRTRDELVWLPDVESKHENLTVLRLPKVLSFRSRDGNWNRAACWMKARLIKRQMDNSRPCVLYFWHASLWPYVRHFAADITVFHVYDLTQKYHVAAYRDSPRHASFQRACDVADIVFVGTQEQAVATPPEKTTVVPNGVHIDWYSTDLDEPADVAGIPRPRVGYVGAISDKVDFDWIEELATNREWQIVLVGPVQNLNRTNERRFREVCLFANVHYLGQKTAQEVPAYMRALDVGLMCYNRGLHCEAASPLKLFEYSAAGIPIVGSRLESLVQDQEAVRFVRLVDTPEEASHAVKDALFHSGNDQDVSDRIQYAKENSWAERARSIADVIATAMDRSRPATAHARMNS